MKHTLSLNLVAIAALLSLATIGGCTGQTSPTPPSTSGGAAVKGPVTLLNVSYDPTRELYQDFNVDFANYWKEKTGQEVTIEQSHGGSGKQARAVIDGLQADVVTLALAYDIDVIAEKAKLLSTDWQSKLKHNSSPYTSTVVFIVRKGNPKQIKDWDDLVKEGVSVITPNPKTSGGARWNYLAAWGYALKQELGDLKNLKGVDPAKLESAQAKAKDFVTRLYKNAPVLDKGARDSTNTFVQRSLGDVLIAWENEAYLAVNELGKDKYELVIPSVSILAEPPVAVVEKVAQEHGTTEVAQAYLEYLYSPAGQKIAAKHYYRPSVEGSLSPDEKAKFAQLELFKIDDVFGGWAKAQAEHFNEGGVFDQIYLK